MITPTVGRIVYYHIDHTYTHNAAIITHVWHDTMVNLTVFEADGNPRAMTSVRLVQPEEEKPEDNPFCCWMPYQVKKTSGSESGEKAAGTTPI